MTAPRSRPAWLALAIGSGACAAVNGAFAKLTTAETTSSFASSISHLFGFGDHNTVVDVLVRGSCFGLNLLFNAIMWALFTRALTLATSTTRVSIINTSANFMVTAVLGALIFNEALPGLWWIGAAMLAAGSVVIGMREEEKTDKVKTKGVHPNAEGRAAGGADVNGQEFRDEPEEDDEVELHKVKSR